LIEQGEKPIVEVVPASFRTFNLRGIAQKKCFYKMALGLRVQSPEENSKVPHAKPAYGAPANHLA